MTLNLCPSAGDLKAFAVGSLPADRFDEVAKHVEACPGCDAALESLGGEGDELLSQLHLLSTTAFSTAEAVVERGSNGHLPARAAVAKLTQGVLALENADAGAFPHAVLRELTDPLIVLAAVRIKAIAGHEFADGFVIHGPVSSSSVDLSLVRRAFGRKWNGGPIAHRAAED